MSVGSKSTATILYQSAVLSVLFFVYTLSFNSSLTVARAQVTNPGTYFNNDNPTTVTVGIVWQNADPQVMTINTFSSHPSSDRSFGINIFAEAEVRVAMIINGPPGAECIVGSSPYEGGGEFTDENRFAGPVSASFIACVVVEPLAEAEFVEREQEDDNPTVGTSRTEGGDGVNNMVIEDIISGGEFSTWLDENTDIDLSDTTIDFGNEWEVYDNDDYQDKNDGDEDDDDDEWLLF